MTTGLRKLLASKNKNYSHDQQPPPCAAVSFGSKEEGVLRLYPSRGETSGCSRPRAPDLLVLGREASLPF
jgi:hypothetical protein